MKRAFFLFPFFCIFGFLIFFPQPSLTYAKTGLLLWFYTLLPSMLPFMILSDFFLHTSKKFWQRFFGLSSKGAYAFLMGISCGYPMGAKVTADLYREHHITKQEACYLLAFSNYPGPAFLSSYICISLFHRNSLILPTYIIIYGSGFFCAFLFRMLSAQKTKENARKKTISPETNKKETSRSLGETLDVSIMNGFESIAKMGGYIILFSILQGILKRLLHPFPCISRLAMGLTEITTGNLAIAQSSWDFSVAYPLVVMFTSFGGLCVTAQTKSMLTDTDLPFIPYLKGKLSCALCALCLAWFLVKIVKVIV